MAFDTSLSHIITSIQKTDAGSTSGKARQEKAARRALHELGLQGFNARSWKKGTCKYCAGTESALLFAIHDTDDLR